MSLYEVEARRIIKIIRKDKSLPEQNSISGSENIARKGTPQCLRLSAVFTLEAAVVMPVLACFFVSVLFFFRIMQIQLEVQRALDDTGRKLAVCSDNCVIRRGGAPWNGRGFAFERDGGPHGSRNLHHRRKVWNQPDWIRFLRGGDHTAGGRIISGCPSGSSGCGILRWNSGQIAGNGQDGVLQREVMKTSGCMSHRQEPSITGSIAARIWSCRSGLWRRRKLRHFAMRTGKHIENACSAGMRKMHSDGSILRTRATATTKILAAAASSEPSA